MTRTLLALALVLSCTVAVILGCRQVPLTERRQLVMVPEDHEIALGVAAYQEVLAKDRLSTNRQYVELVERVGRRVAAVTGRDDYQWEFRVIASDVQNAFCLPGGKVAVYEGILPVCANEAGLAVVMGHEVAHAIARHGAERMSQGMLVKGFGAAVESVTGDAQVKNREWILKAYGVGAQYGVMLPYSRTHESEADRMGLVYMARAGYDPAEAPRFWQRFAKLQQGEKPPEFMSTHPSDERRAADLREQLPNAQAIYEAATQKFGLGDAIGGADVAKR